MPAQQSQWQDQMLGRYHLKRLLGVGGMGEVWLAEDTDLQREVAVKLLPPVLYSQRDYLQAFNREARLVASLEHPHILSVHDFGEFEFGDDIVTYLIMPFIAGGSLLDLINKQQRLMPVEEALRYVRQVAEAIDFAHSKRVLHRDIKPANILLQDDWVFLCDFGIATLLSTQTFRSQAKMSGGTPLYMSPEQCQGRASRASDLYSLAIVAYELLTGITPFEGWGPLEIMLKHIQEEPPSPREFNQRLSQKLADALLRALVKDPEQRPSSCLAFVSDLERIQASEEIFVPHLQNDPASTLIKLRSRELSVTLQSASTIVSDADVREKTQERDAMKTEKPRSLISRRSLLLGGAAGVALLAGGSYALANALSQPPIRWGPQRFMPGVPRLKMTAHSNDVNNVCWSPDSRLLASAGRDTHVMVWDTNAALTNASGKLQVLARPSAQWKMPDEIFQGDLSWSPDGRFLATEARFAANARINEGTLSTIDVFTSNSQIVNNVDRNSKYKDLYNFVSPVWSPDGKLIATAVNNTSMDYVGAIIFWNPPEANSEQGIVKVFNSTIKPIRNNYSGLQILRWSLDGSRILSLDTQDHLSSWDAKTGKQDTFALPDRSIVVKSLQKLLLDIPNSRSLETTPARPEQVLVDDVDLAIVYDLKQKKAATLLAVADPEKGPISLTALAWSSNGRYVAGCHFDSKQIYIWDLADPHPQMTGEGFILPTLAFGKTNGHSAIIIDLDWSPDGCYLASASVDFSVIVWQVDAELEN